MQLEFINCWLYVYHCTNYWCYYFLDVFYFHFAVEPDQVEHLRTENVTSRSATIAWGSPYPVKKLRYEINVTLMQEDGSLDHSNTKVKTMAMA